MVDDPVPRILIIDDEWRICRNCVKILSELPCEVDYALDGFDGLKIMAQKPFHVVVTDLKMGAMGGMEVLRRIQSMYPDTMVVIMTGYASISSAVEVMKMGAMDYLPKPFTPQELRGVVRQAIDRRAVQVQNRQLKDQPERLKSFSHQLIGNSPEMHKVIQMIEKVASTDSTVLIYGESGTGKELVARAVYANSHRKKGPFFAVDCGTLSSHLIENELFGHVRGAFTGAHKDKDGIFKLAHGGTVFLDEISNLNLDVQSKLLRFLETREFFPLGGTSPEQVDVRLIFATNKNLKDLVAAGDFREDFYYRIFVYPIPIPPLRERKSDILPIAYHFLKQYNSRLGKQIAAFDDDAARRLTQYDWPGNVRQLRNVVERAVIHCEEKTVTTEELPLLGVIGDANQQMEVVPSTGEDLKRLKKKIREKAVEPIEKLFVINALVKNDWNVTEAARKTGLQRTNFQALMKKHGIKLPRHLDQG